MRRFGRVMGGLLLVLGLGPCFLGLCACRCFLVCLLWLFFEDDEDFYVGGVVLDDGAVVVDVDGVSVFGPGADVFPCGA